MRNGQISHFCTFSTVSLAGKIIMKKNSKYTYRLMKADEADYVYDMILRVFHKHVAPTYSQKGIETFLSMLSPEFLKERNLEKFTIVAVQKDKLIGTLSMINMSHIALLFVNSEMQGNGIGNSLIQFGINKCLEDHPDVKAITVSSTSNSLSFYQNVGFEIIGEEANENGMRFIPMRKMIDKKIS